MFSFEYEPYTNAERYVMFLDGIGILILIILLLVVVEYIILIICFTKHDKPNTSLHDDVVAYYYDNYVN